MSTPDALMQTARSEMSGFQGRLTGPDDAGYDEARKVYNAMIDRRPALIATLRRRRRRRARSSPSPRDHDLLLAVRGGSHNGAGLGTCDDGVVLDLSGLKEIEVDPGPGRRGSAAAAPGAKSTPPPTSTGWRRRAGSSRPPASAVSPSAAASAT